MTATEHSPAEALPRWDVSDIHPSVGSQSLRDHLERCAADADRLVALFDELDIRSTADRPPTRRDGEHADRALIAYNRVATDLGVLRAYVHSYVSTDSRDERAQALATEVQAIDATMRPLLARLADWTAALGPAELADVSEQAADHRGPLERLAARADHQMSEVEEHLYAELSSTGAAAWARLQRDVTSQLEADVVLPDGPARLPLTAVRGLATDPRPHVRRAAYDAELLAWPTIATPVAAAMNGVKGEAVVIDRRRGWDDPLDASLFANSVSRPTFEAMQSAVTAALDDFRGWMRVKAAVHGHDPAAGLPWWDLVAPLPTSVEAVSWHQGLGTVRRAFGAYGPALAELVERAVDDRWIDAEPRTGKTGGAFCMGVSEGRSLVLLNWSGSADATQTTAHELGHAYHNTALAGRTPLQRRLPMALAETASIFCETLVVEDGLARTTGDEHLALLDVDLQGANQVVVDIRSRFLFEREVYRRRRRASLSANELCELMLDAQREAYGDGLDQSTAHPYMWLLKPHYYSSAFYNWPYTYGLLFGLGLYAEYRRDPERFRAGYDTLLSRAGMDTAEELGTAFGLDVTDEAFWTASLDVVRHRIDRYRELVGDPEGRR